MPCKKIYFVNLPVYGSSGTEEEVRSSLGQKKNYVCFLLHLQNIRVGRSLLIFFYFIFNFYFSFSMILPRNTTDAGGALA